MIYQFFGIFDLPNVYRNLTFSLPKWHTPNDLLAMHHDKTVWLPPPQFYELHRFSNFPKIDEIAKFSKSRDGQDVPLILPINFMLKDSMMLVYPGDDLYPSDANMYETAHDHQKYQDKTYDEMKTGCKNFSRIEMKNMFASNFLCNIEDGLLSAAKMGGPKL